MNIVELRDLGITTTLTESGKLHLEARPGLMTPVLRELITRNRAYLVQELVCLAESVNMGELGELHSLMFEPETTSYAPTGKVHHAAEKPSWLTQSAANDHEPPADPSTWRELAAEYHTHHFSCPTCQAAGRGANYGQRCDTGLALWLAYQAII